MNVRKMYNITLLTQITVSSSLHMDFVPAHEIILSVLFSVSSKPSVTTTMVTDDVPSLTIKSTSTNL